MSHSLTYRVYVTGDDGTTHAFGPGGDVPEWAASQITNPSAWGEESEADDAAQPDGGTKGDQEPEVVPYAKRKKADLEAEVESRNEGREQDDLIVVDGKGTVADLVAALEADDAAQADNN